MIPGPVAYNLPQKKCDFQKLAFLLEKSVHAGKDRQGILRGKILVSSAIKIHPKTTQVPLKSATCALSNIGNIVDNYCSSLDTGIL